MSDTEPIVSLHQHAPGRAVETTKTRPLQTGYQAARGPKPGQTRNANQPVAANVSFDRRELTTILSLYGSKVAQGEWRDYAMDFNRDCAVFAVFRRTSEMPLYRIEKNPKLARRQGAYSVIAPGGLILRRGHDLVQVLKVLARRPKLVSA